jgi:hypothetical protein
MNANCKLGAEPKIALTDITHKGDGSESSEFISKLLSTIGLVWRGSPERSAPGGQTQVMSEVLRQRIRDGDPQAFAELFDQCARSVYNHAFRLVADWSTAEDVMAMTFQKAWQLRDRVDPDGGPS